MKTREEQLRRIRTLIAVVIAGLVGSGLSAFPLLRESERMAHFVNAVGFPDFVRAWMWHVHAGLAATYAAYPFVGYGTDWLAFGHLVVALFVIGAFIDPVRNVWVIRASMIACVLVIPNALICGAMRGIPFWWRAIDSSFGIAGFIPLWLAHRMIRRLPN
jgi:hypothetical protein